MNTKFKQKIQANTLSYILICGGIIFIIILLGVIPLYRYNANRSQDIKKIQSQIEEQKGLGGIYQLLQNASAKKEIHTLPNPEKTKLSRRDVDNFQSAFRTEVGKAGLMTISLIPDVKTIGAGSQHLLYDVTLKGEFKNFRRLLIGLGAVPYVDHIEEIDIKQYSDSMEFKMKVWIALAD